MRHIRHSNEVSRTDFALRAARYFGQHPEAFTYTDGDIAPSEWFAMRFGLDNDCVVVFRIGDDEPCNYEHIIDIDTF